MSQRRIDKPRTPRPQGTSVLRELTPDEARQVQGAREEVLAEEHELLQTADKVFAAIEKGDALLDRIVLLLRDERMRQKVTFADLARRTGMTRSAISNLEHLKGANPTITTIVRLADALGLDIAVRLVHKRRKAVAGKK